DDVSARLGRRPRQGLARFEERAVFRPELLAGQPTRRDRAVAGLARVPRRDLGVLAGVVLLLAKGHLRVPRETFLRQRIQLAPRRRRRHGLRGLLRRLRLLRLFGLGRAPGLDRRLGGLLRLNAREHARVVRVLREVYVRRGGAVRAGDEADRDRALGERGEPEHLREHFFGPLPAESGVTPAGR